MELPILAILVLLPVLCALLIRAIDAPVVRAVIVIANSIIIAAAALYLGSKLIQAGQPLQITIHNEGLPIDTSWIIKGLDLLLLIYIGYLGVKLKNVLIVALTTLQFIPFFLFELLQVFGPVEEPANAFTLDYLSLVMILLVSLIGPIITIFALGYMKEHEHHQHLNKSMQPKFFMVMLIFLGAMNALCLTNNLSWMYFFWEVTTLCSFLLISHDKNEISIKNATRALWMNSLGGVAFISAIVIIYLATNTLDISEIIRSSDPTNFVGLLPIGLGLLCFAGFTKSAQFPFQSWLLGAMVAPTPVSALLHSSTMVKAGVYLVLRFSPAYSNTILANLVAIIGGFTFLAASAVAISQRNGKRVLAYSTIANLGLIICCAGIDNHAALGAAILLMIFHALSKGLLFLCVGTIEHGIGSRDIEDMQGLMKRMPFTTFVTVIGMISMLLPPFGVLITKWLAIEASVNSPLVLICIVLGSAFTVVFWAKWIGIILTMSYKPQYNTEKLPNSVNFSLIMLVSFVIAVSIQIVTVFNFIIRPYLSSLPNPGSAILGSIGLELIIVNAENAISGGFAVLIFFIVLLVVMLTIPLFINRTKPEAIKAPYLCGSNTDDHKGLEFIGPGDKNVSIIVRNYYLSGTFGESNLSIWLNVIAGALILIMFGVVM